MSFVGAGLGRGGVVARRHSLNYMMTEDVCSSYVICSDRVASPIWLLMIVVIGFPFWMELVSS
jgi:hypothetical protein